MKKTKTRVPMVRIMNVDLGEKVWFQSKRYLVHSRCSDGVWLRGAYGSDIVIPSDAFVAVTIP